MRGINCATAETTGRSSGSELLHILCKFNGVNKGW